VGCGLVLIIAAACAPAPVPANSELVGPVWQLATFANGRGNLQPVLPGTHATATFGGTGWLTGTGGCSPFTAVFQSQAITLAIVGPIMTTPQPCEQPMMAQESAYLGALARTATFRIEGDRLVLVQSGGATLAEYSR
jgi:heat shock protein HslJ